MVCNILEPLVMRPCLLLGPYSYSSASGTSYIRRGWLL